MTTPDAKVRRGPVSASTYDLMLVQEAMAVAGFYDGPVDGISGPRTRLAVRAYKRLHGLAVDDSVRAEFLEYLRDVD